MVSILTFASMDTPVPAAFFFSFLSYSKLAHECCSAHIVPPSYRRKLILILLCLTHRTQKIWNCIASGQKVAGSNPSPPPAGWAELHIKVSLSKILNSSLLLVCSWLMCIWHLASGLAPAKKKKKKNCDPIKGIKRLQMMDGCITVRNSIIVITLLKASAVINRYTENPAWERFCTTCTN